MNKVVDSQAAIDAINSHFGFSVEEEYGSAVQEVINSLPPAKPRKSYTKADYIMCLHEEYGCSCTKAEKAHEKALEYLRDTSMLKG